LSGARSLSNLRELGKHLIEIEFVKCENNSSVNIKHKTKDKTMPPQLVQLVQNLQSLTSQIAAIVLASTGTNPSSAPQNVQAAFATVQAASATLATDIAATPFVSATVENDVSALQSALTALQTALANPSNP
jgi:uncharacterized protein